jgi:hypothetical protein
MPVTIKPATNDVDPAARHEIDALGALDNEYQAAKKLVKAYDDRKKKLVEALGASVPEDQARIVKGDQFYLDLGEKGEQRSIKDLSRLIQIMGPELFLQVAKVNIGDVVQYVPSHQLDEVLKSERTGSRAAKFKKIEG